MLVVTGANGFIGSALVWKLNQEQIDDIVCVDRVPIESRPEILQNLKFNKFLLHLELDDFLSSSDGKNVKGVFHMGACSDTTEQDAEFLEENNTQYTNRLFKKCMELNIPFIYASSAAVYGDGQLGFSDKTPSENFKPLNLYGESKLKSDVWISQQKWTPPRWYGLRFFNVYGPNEYHKGDMRSLVHKAYEQVLETGKLKLFKSYKSEFADGKQLRDFVYIKDVVHWMWLLFNNIQVKSGIYNMGYGRARTWLDLAQAVFANLEKEMKIDWIEMPDNIRNHYQYFTEAKMKALFAQKIPTPLWSIEAGIEDYIKNYLVSDYAYLRN